MEYFTRTIELGGKKVKLDPLAQEHLGSLDVSITQLADKINRLQQWEKQVESLKQIDSPPLVLGKLYDSAISTGMILSQQWHVTASICGMVVEKLNVQIKSTGLMQREPGQNARQQIKDLQKACTAEATDIEGLVAILQSKLEQ